MAVLGTKVIKACCLFVGIFIDLQYAGAATIVPFLSASTETTELPAGSPDENIVDGTRAAIALGVLFGILAVSYGIAKCVDYIHDRRSLNDADSDISEHTRNLLKQRLKFMFNGLARPREERERSQREAAKVTLSKWKGRAHKSASERATRLAVISEEKKVASGLGLGAVAANNNTTDFPSNTPVLLNAVNLDRNGGNELTGTNVKLKGEVMLVSYTPRSKVDKMPGSPTRSVTDDDFTAVEMRVPSPGSDSPRDRPSLSSAAPPSSVGPQLAPPVYTLVMPKISDIDTSSEFSTEGVVFTAPDTTAPLTIPPSSHRDRGRSKASSKASDVQKASRYVRPLTGGSSGGSSTPSRPVTAGHSRRITTGARGKHSPGGAKAGRAY